MTRKSDPPWILHIVNASLCLFMVALEGGSLALASESQEASTATSRERSEENKERSIWNPSTWKWIPTDEEIQRYRQSWNPMAHGPILISGVDIQPKGQFLFQPFVFGQTGSRQFGNQFGTNSTDLPGRLTAVSPTGIFAYGVTDHAELNVALSGIYWEASNTNGTGGRTPASETGLGDTTIYLKYRPIVQDPVGAQPTLQYKFFHDENGALVGALGCLFTIAGQNNIDAIYPNVALYYYWGRGKPIMR